MDTTEEKIVKIIDADNTNIQASVEDVGGQGALITKIVAGGGSPVTDPWDYLEVAYPTTTSEVFTYKNGGSGGSTVATITVVYTDTTKNYISTLTVA